MNAPEEVVVVAELNDGLVSAGRVLLVLNRCGHRVSRLSFEATDTGGAAQLVLEVRASDGGARLVRQISRIVSVVNVAARVRSDGGRLSRTS